MVQDLQRDEKQADFSPLNSQPPLPPPAAVPPNGAVSDARLLPILIDSAGRRYRSTRSAAELSSEMSFADWPIEGPRTTGYVLGELAKTGLVAAARHQRWRFDNVQKPEMRTCIVQ